MSSISLENLNGNPNQGLQNDAKYNGRVFFEENEYIPGYQLYEGSNKPQQCFQNSISNIQETSNLSNAFFSRENVDKIQNNIIERVRIESNNEFNIGRQSDLQLQIIMRSIYLSNSKNLNYNIQQQVAILNDSVVDEFIKQIIPNIKQYLSYRKEISSPRYIMPHSQPVSSGNNSLPGNPYI